MTEYQKVAKVINALRAAQKDAHAKGFKDAVTAYQISIRTVQEVFGKRNRTEVIRK